MTPREAYINLYVKREKNRELEEIVATDSMCSYMYAKDVLKGPFEACHKEIFTKKPDKENYYIDYSQRYIDFLKSINHDFKGIEEWAI